DQSAIVYVYDSRYRRIQKFDASGTFLTAWGSLGSGNGQFRYPVGVATDWSRNVYVADSANNRIQIFACPLSSTTTTTSTTTTSTTTTLPPCGQAQASACNGTCPTNTTCTFDFVNNVCFC